MTEYSRSAKGSFVSANTAQAIYLPFQPTLIKLKNLTAYKNFAASDIPDAWWDITMGQGTAACKYVDSTVLTTAYIPTGGFQTIAAGISLQYGPTVFLGTTGGAGIAKTNSTTLTVTTAAAHGLLPGNWVIFQNLYQTTTTGMQQLAGIPFEVLTTTSTTFTIGWVGNAANLTAITTAATGAASFKQILYPVLYAPQVAYPWSITVSAGVGTVMTTAPHNFQVGQEIGFRIPSVYGATQLNELPDVLIPGSPQYYYVASVVSATEFTFNNAPAITAFSVANPAFTSFPGLKFAQVVATGDINSGGYPYTGGSLYPSPTVYNGNSLTASNTINGPAIQGAYINATWQGFIIGAGNAVYQGGSADASSYLCGETSDVVFWEAYLTDIAMP